MTSITESRVDTALEGYRAVERLRQANQLEADYLEAQADQLSTTIRESGPDTRTRWAHALWEIEHERYADLVDKAENAKSPEMRAAASKALRRCEQQYSQSMKTWSPERRAWEAELSAEQAEHPNWVGLAGNTITEDEEEAVTATA